MQRCRVYQAIGGGNVWLRGNFLCEISIPIGATAPTTDRAINAQLGRIAPNIWPQDGDFHGSDDWYLLASDGVKNHVFVYSEHYKG